MRNAVTNPDSVFGNNILYCVERWGIDAQNVLLTEQSQLDKLIKMDCNFKCNSTESHITAGVIKELLMCKYGELNCGLAANEVDELLNVLCTM